MKHTKLFEEFEFKNVQSYSDREVVLLIIDAVMTAMGDEWTPDDDDNFKTWLKSNGLLETFEKISKE